ncbi:MAG: hypothetical protein ACMG57_00490 [Candidatus Dojkabacteria bacterium]
MENTVGKTYLRNNIKSFNDYLKTFFEALSDEVILESIFIDGDYFLVSDGINTSPQMGAIVYWCPVTVKSILEKRKLLKSLKGYKEKETEAAFAEA